MRPIILLPYCALEDPEKTLQVIQILRRDLNKRCFENKSWSLMISSVLVFSELCLRSSAYPRQCITGLNHVLYNRWLSHFLIKLDIIGTGEK